MVANKILTADLWEQVGKILLNALIYKGIKTNVQKNTVASIFHTSVSTMVQPRPDMCSAYLAQHDSDPCYICSQDAQSSEQDGGKVVARPYLFRLKNEEAAMNLSAAIKENVPLD
jgi:nuclear pore complex protein Nup50